MANEKRLIDANAIKYWEHTECYGHGDFETVRTVSDKEIAKMPTVDAVEVGKYNALVEMYHDLRENFIDYYCSGIPNVAPYCLNRCEECVTPHGWCKALSDKCRGFNPAEVILDEERRTMYKSPIDIIYGQMETQMEGTIMRAIQKVDVNVDKEELIRALQYDRGQYENGYADAMASIVRCKDCKLALVWVDSKQLVCTKSVNWRAVEPDHFCSYGERKDNERKAD